MSKITRDDWILEEYRLLTQHYFHEDNYYLKSNTVFMTLNAAMIAFMGSRYENGITNDFMLLFSFVGIMSIIAWNLSLLRVRFCRVRIEKRIKEVEIFIQETFNDDSSSKENLTTILNLRAKSIYTPWFAQIPSSLIMLILPTVFLSIWLYFLYRAIV